MQLLERDGVELAPVSSSTTRPSTVLLTSLPSFSKTGSGTVMVMPSCSSAAFGSSGSPGIGVAEPPPSTPSGPMPKVWPATVRVPYDALPLPLGVVPSLLELEDVEVTPDIVTRPPAIVMSPTAEREVPHDLVGGPLGL